MVTRWFLETVLQCWDEFSTSGCFPGVWLDLRGHYARHTEAYPLAAGGKYRSLLFTRNPHARLASAFINKFYVNGRTPIDALESLEPFARGFLERFGLSTQPYRGISFRQFVNTLATARRDGIPLDHHWDTQFPLALEPRLEYPAVDHVVRIEFMDVDWPPVTADLGLSAPTGKGRNRTKYPVEFQESADFLGDRTTGELLAEKLAVRPANLYDPDITACVATLYSSDYARLPYERRSL